MVQCSTFISGAFALLLLFPAYARADDFFKNAAFTCDEEKNLAVITLNAGYTEYPEAAVALPEKYSAQFSGVNKHVNRVTGNSSHGTCGLKNGQQLSVSSEVGQPYPYGQSRGDAPAYFTFRIDDKFVFYKYNFYGGYGASLFGPLVVLYDGKTLVACDGKRSDPEGEASTSEVADCKDISSRLTAELDGFEAQQYRRDLTIEAYQPIVSDPEVCHYFHLEEVREKIQGEYIPAWHTEKYTLDLNNDGKPETVYRRGARGNSYDGSFLAFFDKEQDEKAFLKCMEDKNCPEDFPRYKDGKVMVHDVRAILNNGYWPSAHFISSNNLSGTNISAPYDGNYTWTYVAPFKGKNYIYFVPLNWDSLPSSVVALLQPDGKLKPICTYKDYDGSAR